jgi:AmmeMemoRadiSam system protein B
LSHRYSVCNAAICARGSFCTLLGDIEIDETVAADIMGLSSRIINLPPAHASEHSLEVQLLFLQRSISHIRIVPILLQDDSSGNVIPLSQAIVQALGARSALLIGSTDLCHYPVYQEVRKADQVVIESFTHFDADYLRNQMETYMRIHLVQELHCMVCSTGAIYITMEATKRLGGNQIEVLKAANSGAVPMGTHSQVVGYMAAAIYR